MEYKLGTGDYDYQHTKLYRINLVRGFGRVEQKLCSRFSWERGCTMLAEIVQLVTLGSRGLRPCGILTGWGNHDL